MFPLWQPGLFWAHHTILASSKSVALLRCALSGSVDVLCQQYTQQLSRLTLQMCIHRGERAVAFQNCRRVSRRVNWRCAVTGGESTNVLGPGVQLGTCRAASEAQAPFLQLECSAAVYTKPARALPMYNLAQVQQLDQEIKGSFSGWPSAAVARSQQWDLTIFSPCGLATRRTS